MRPLWLMKRVLAIFHRIGDNDRMARKAKSERKTASTTPERRGGMSRSALVKRSGVSKQQLSRLENAAAYPQCGQVIIDSNFMTPNLGTQCRSGAAREESSRV